MSDFRVGITADVLKSDDTPIFGKAVLGLLDAAGIDWEYMEASPAVTRVSIAQIAS